MQLKVMRVKNYRRVEKEESDWEGEENRELRCLQGRGHDAHTIQLCVVPAPPLLRSPDPFPSLRASTSTIPEVGFKKDLRYAFRTSLPTHPTPPKHCKMTKRPLTRRAVFTDSVRVNRIYLDSFRMFGVRRCGVSKEGCGKGAKI